MDRYRMLHTLTENGCIAKQVVDGLQNFIDLEADAEEVVSVALGPMWHQTFRDAIKRLEKLADRADAYEALTYLCNGDKVMLVRRIDGRDFKPVYGFFFMDENPEEYFFVEQEVSQTHGRFLKFRLDDIISVDVHTEQQLPLIITSFLDPARLATFG